MNWYAIYTKRGCERAVSERLRAKGFQTYLPTIPVRRKRGDTVKRPFFRCYLFAQLDLNTDKLSSVRWTPGLKYVVSFGEKPAIIPDQVIALVRRRLAAIEASGGLPAHSFQSGDRVRIRSGPFADFEAVFEQTLKPAERARVLIHFLDRMSKVQVAVEDLEPVGAGTAGSMPRRSRRTRGQGRRIKYRTNDECLS